MGWVAISFSGDLPDSGIEPASLMSLALALTGRLFTTRANWPPASCYPHTKGQLLPELTVHPVTCLLLGSAAYLLPPSLFSFIPAFLASSSLGDLLFHLFEMLPTRFVSSGSWRSLRMDTPSFLKPGLRFSLDGHLGEVLLWHI